MFKYYFQHYKIQGNTLFDKIKNILENQHKIKMGSRINKNVVTYDITDTDLFEGVLEADEIIKKRKQMPRLSMELG